MNITYTKMIIIIVSCIILFLIKPIVRFCMRDRYKSYKDVYGNDIKIKTYGYIKMNEELDSKDKG